MIACIDSLYLSHDIIDRLTRRSNRTSIDRVAVDTRLSIGHISVEYSTDISGPTLLSVDMVGVHRYFTELYRSIYRPIVSSIGRIHRSRHRSAYFGRDIGRVYLSIHRSIVFNTIRICCILLGACKKR